jgi:hypothetical protein
MRIFEIAPGTKNWAEVANINIKIPNELNRSKQKINVSHQNLMLLINNKSITNRTQIELFKNQLISNSQEIILDVKTYLDNTQLLANLDPDLDGRRDKVDRVRRSLLKSILKIKEL